MIRKSLLAGVAAITWLAAHATPVIAEQRPLPAGRLFGVTLDDVSDIGPAVEAFGLFQKRPVTRIVFDKEMTPDDYRPALDRIASVSYVMGELLDSSDVASLTSDAVQTRARSYVASLSDRVDIWEVGNEVNGEWLGEADAVVAKISAAEKAVKDAGGVTALTLYYNEGCYEDPGHEMFTWVEDHLSDALRRSFDYVFISYYEDDCNGLKPNWEPVFGRLGTLFPAASLGFGEIGTKAPERKVDLMQRYYGMQLTHPRFVGGYFWWYGRQDLVPATTPYWQALNQIVGAW